ncbi:DUF547 domain-containing protein [Mariprofundus ferrooxydans]|uniref:DUF547 domain-containing protein n=1 Tax=Mariprofundus ferrooxydans PV-1 TaxID=314345 RepID=Q0EWS1_9PROT|nr:DUF547 domain-containing protein [Mariprofundus ferrooxydans]EAU53718.1 hypothetical protein SPV1_06249 [Mariprofundus ferrooxydans PV-1]KON48521.1 hypothetical protein AL013_02525 [Mariprofundus ferrooxydans]
MLRASLLLLCSWFLVPAAGAEPFDHGEWDALLKAYVQPQGATTVVDYAGFAAAQTRLKAYQDRLSGVKPDEFDQWDNKEQLAFLINAYNAWTVALVLTAYPDIKSIKDTGSLFSSPWHKAFIPLLGKTRSLDDIEHYLIRGSGRYNDPRIHFAVNCASIGCPALRPEAYSGDRLDTQLDEQTRLFLSDHSRNRLEDGILRVSSIFKWYREDFEKGWRGLHALPSFFARHAAALGLSAADTKRLLAGHIDIEYQDYDWRLNAKRS